MTTHISTRISDEDARIFEETTQSLGISPSDALRMFIAAFNRNGGFPFDVQVKPIYEAVRTEGEAIDLCDHLAEELLDKEYSTTPDIGLLP